VSPLKTFLNCEVLKVIFAVLLKFPHCINCESRQALFLSLVQTLPSPSCSATAIAYKVVKMLAI